MENLTLPKYTYFYARNQLGDIIELYFTGGQKIATYEYDAWGKVIGVKDVTGNAITSSTQYCKPEFKKIQGLLL